MKKRRLPPLPKTEWTAKVAEWHEGESHGWLQFGDKRVILHSRDYSGPLRLPLVNDEVRFVLGWDAQRRPCALRAVPARGGFRVGIRRYALLVLLLLLPAAVVYQCRAHLVPIVAGLFLVSAITFAAYSSDKIRARRGAWRISENSLHLLELMGGWPGAWVAQRYLRHKCSKTSYQIAFSLIILTHQLAAYDALQDWKVMRLVLPQARALKIQIETLAGPMLVRNRTSPSKALTAPASGSARSDP